MIGFLRVTDDHLAAGIDLVEHGEMYATTFAWLGPSSVLHALLVLYSCRRLCKDVQCYACHAHELAVAMLLGKCDHKTTPPPPPPPPHRHTPTSTRAQESDCVFRAANGWVCFTRDRAYVIDLPFQKYQWKYNTLRNQYNKTDTKSHESVGGDLFGASFSSEPTALADAMQETALPNQPIELVGRQTNI